MRATILPTLGLFLPVLDEIASVVQDSYTYVIHETTLSRSVAVNGIVRGRGYSLFRSAMFSFQRYHSSPSSFFLGSWTTSFISRNRII